MRGSLVQHIKRFSGFALMPALSMLASIALLPLIAAKFGAQSWVALGLGQSLGAIVGVLVALAWPIIGGHEIASTSDSSERQRIFRRSVYSRGIVLAVLVPLAACGMLFLPNHMSVEATLFMAGNAFNGMTASWYFAGTGQPRYLVRNEGLVRLASYAVTLVGIGACGLGLWWYGFITVLAGISMALLNWTTIVGIRFVWSLAEFRESAKLIPAQLNGTLSRILQSLFYYGANSVYTIWAPGSLAVFAAADQIKRITANALGMIPTTFVSWVGAASGVERVRRQRLSIGSVTIISVLTIVGWILFGNTIVGYLFAGNVELKRYENVLLICGVVANLLTYSVELLVMVPKQLQTFVYNSNSFASIVGLIGLAIAASQFGVGGGLAVLLLIKVALLIVYGSRLLWRGKYGVAGGTAVTIGNDGTDVHTHAG